jgi:hypothetical protein
MTYVFGNVELFFCLYHNDWNNPPQCNSSNSILFGFLTTVPGIMRAAQCFRRFAETGDAFPHLVRYPSLSIIPMPTVWGDLCILQ